MVNLFRKLSKIFSLIFTPVLVVFNVIIFTGYYLFLGPNYAIKFFEKIGKPGIIPLLRLYGAKIGKNCDIQTGIIFHNCYDFSNLEIGNNCHIGKNCFFDLRDKVIIKNNVVISMQTTIITHIDISKSQLSKIFPPLTGEIIICENCYIGVGACILMGSVIGSNSIVAARSIILQNEIIENNSVFAGVPAKLKRKLTI